MISDKFNVRIRFILLIGLFGLYSCSKDRDITGLTNTKWKVYSVQVLAIGYEACDYKTQPSDLYGTPVYTTCEMDDIYFFGANNKLIINYGTLKCSQSEPTDSTLVYERLENSLTINNQDYGIIKFTNDTLILDYCTYTSIPPFESGKIGMKLIRID
jgi:hypothetical protein